MLIMKEMLHQTAPTIDYVGTFRISMNEIDSERDVMNQTRTLHYPHYYYVMQCTGLIHHIPLSSCLQAVLVASVAVA